MTEFNSYIYDVSLQWNDDDDDDDDDGQFHPKKIRNDHS